MLHLSTTSPALLELIRTVSGVPELADFRLVGGTALSLYLGHRISVDADFFSLKDFDKRVIEEALIGNLPSIMKVHDSAHGFTWVFQNIKLDLYSWKVPFLNPVFEGQGLRIAAIEDVAALKMDALTNRKEEKDFRDVHALLELFSLEELLKIYHEHYPFNSPRIVIDHLTAIEHVERDSSIYLLKEVTWKAICEEIGKTIQQYFEKVKIQKDKSAEERQSNIQKKIDQLKGKE